MFFSSRTLEFENDVAAQLATSLLVCTFAEHNSDRKVRRRERWRKLRWWHTIDCVQTRTVQKSAQISQQVHIRSRVQEGRILRSHGHQSVRQVRSRQGQGPDVHDGSLLPLQGVPPPQVRCHEARQRRSMQQRSSRRMPARTILFAR